MRIGSLFSGAGGLDLAVQELFDGDVVWHSEMDPAASKVLAHRFPGVPNLGDITKVDWTLVQWVEVLCGGFPCQDVSAAGRRAGIQEGTRSGLWAMFADAIAALRPRYVVIENVRGLLSADGEPWPDEVHAANTEANRLRRIVALIGHKINKAIRNGWWHGEHKQRKQFEADRMARQRDRALARFRSLRRRLVQRAIGTVVRDLADLGYDAQWTTISASSVGAPHRRERVFILATSAHSGDAAEHGQWTRPQLGWGDQDAADATSDRRDEGWTEPARIVGGSDVAVGGDGSATDAAGQRRADIEGCGDETRQPVLPEPGTGSGDRSGTGTEGVRELRRSAGELAPVDLLPTPAASRSGRNQSPSPGAAIRPSLDSITELLPTPRARDGKGRDPNPRGVDLNEAVSLLPTPSVADGDGGHLNRSGGRSDELLLPGVARAYGNGELLPTPTTRDHKGPNQRNDASCLHGALFRTPQAQDWKGGMSNQPSVWDQLKELLPTPTTADGERGPDFARADRDGSGGDDLVTICARATREIGSERWGKYAPAIVRWEAVTRPAPSPTEPNRNGNPRLAAAFPEWMLGWPAGWVTDVPDVSRNDMLRIVGNGVCPQQAHAALTSLLSVCAVAA